MSLLSPLVDAMTDSKIPAFLYVGLCKDDIFIAQDLKAEFASLHPWKETLKDRAFKSSLDSSVEVRLQSGMLWEGAMSCSNAGDDKKET